MKIPFGAYVRKSFAVIFNQISEINANFVFRQEYQHFG